MINWKIPNDKIRLHDFNIEEDERERFDNDAKKAKRLRLLFGTIFTLMTITSISSLYFPPHILADFALPKWVTVVANILFGMAMVESDYEVCRFRRESAIPWKAYLTHPGEWFRGLKKP